MDIVDGSGGECDRGFRRRVELQVRTILYFSQPKCAANAVITQFCSSGAHIVYCGQLNALEAFAWVEWYVPHRLHPSPVLSNIQPSLDFQDSRHYHCYRGACPRYRLITSWRRLPRSTRHRVMMPRFRYTSPFTTHFSSVL